MLHIGIKYLKERFRTRSELIAKLAANPTLYHRDIERLVATILDESAPLLNVVTALSFAVLVFPYGT